MSAETWETEDDIIFEIKRALSRCSKDVGGFPDELTINFKTGKITDKTSWETLSGRGLSKDSFTKEPSVSAGLMR